MTEPEEVNGVDEAGDKKQKKASKHDSGAADLERVTDYAEEKEITSKEITNAANMFEEKRNKENEEKLAKERELQKVHVKKEDIELIIREMEITRSKAEETLRVHRGDVVSALEALTN
ncbi:huntingtin-interacting protein K [Toxorhynchites rutilus septentrionalis]|uniref:huntingtin-interacting protein K n=1 Tax=Toxorhynchites rutilus septentrionalis TaxID=329112 RepID=UPI00247B0DA7|nr:huntingtin-interacting protein K [Toxorhynchites rutilus septentrionalis]